MPKNLINTYKIPLLASLTLSVVLIALKVEQEALAFTFIVLGSFFGTFILDLDYFIYAFFIEPEKDFSKTLVGFVKHGDFLNAFSYINYHKSDMQDKTLNSALFQMVIGGASIFVAVSTANLFIKALVLSVFVNSLYRLAEHYFDNTTDSWFWALKQKPGKQGILLYSAVLLGVLIYTLTLF